MICSISLLWFKFHVELKALNKDSENFSCGPAIASWRTLVKAVTTLNLSFPSCEIPTYVTRVVIEKKIHELCEILNYIQVASVSIFTYSSKDISCTQYWNLLPNLDRSVVTNPKQWFSVTILHLLMKTRAKQ
jgi:hypothetical protein